MAEILIRQAGPGDGVGIHELEKLCFSDPWSRESIEYELEENPAAFYLVAELAADSTREAESEAEAVTIPGKGVSEEPKGKILAYAGLWWILDEGHITNVAVRPEYRGKGIGKAILRALLGSTEEGLRSYTLEVRRSNAAARSLYERFGFQVEGIRKGYYQDNKEDALIMWRRNAD